MLRHSIGTKIFGAFLTMSVIIAGVGAYGYFMLRSSREIVADTYDHTLMAINFARAASVDFLQMQNDALRAETLPPADGAKLSREIDGIASTLSADLDVANERAGADDERDVIRKLRNLVALWQERRHSALSEGRTPDLAGLDKDVISQFGLLIEFNADHGLVSRREAITQISWYEDAMIGMTAFAFVLALSMTFLLARRVEEEPEPALAAG